MPIDLDSLHQPLTDDQGHRAAPAGLAADPLYADLSDPLTDTPSDPVQMLVPSVKRPKSLSTEEALWDEGVVSPPASAPGAEATPGRQRQEPELDH